MGLRDLLAGPLRLAWRLGQTLRPAETGFRTLLFHDIPATHRETFTRLLDHIAARHGFLTPDEAAEILLGTRPAPPAKGGRLPVLLTFDDGFVSNLDVAQTLLAPRGITALFFVCPDLTDLSGAAQMEQIAACIFDRKRSPDRVPERLMTWEEIRQLRDTGHAIGAHTQNHRRLATLDAAALADEIGGCAQRLEQELNADIPWFAFPFGDIGSISAEALAAVKSRHPLCRSGVRGITGGETHSLAARADHIDLSASWNWILLSLEGGLDPRYAQPRKELDRMAETAAR